jgi:large subunit ribosomal protein L2
MLIKKKSTSNGVRHKLILKKFLLCKKTRLHKASSFGKKVSNAGRSSTSGHITVRSKCSGSKKLFRSFVRQERSNFSILISIFYDARRSSFVSLCYNFLTMQFYNCLATRNTYPGTIISNYKTFCELRLGFTISVEKAPAGSFVHSIQGEKNHSCYVKAAGCFGVIMQKKSTSMRIKMPSGIIKLFPMDSLCVLGAVSNEYHRLIVYGKAGSSKHRGRRPKVRGVAMNPIDHPHGGQTSGGMPSVTPWGIPTKGKPTKKKNYVKI